jgi:type 1 glutamine amidotransferase/HEAT repeat protein
MLKSLNCLLILGAIVACTSVEKPALEKPGDALGARIFDALPNEPHAAPLKPRKLLVVSVCKGYAHDSIPTVKRALKMMGAKTGAFEPFFMDHMEAFNTGNLAQFDAVLLNNTTQLAFDDPESRQALLDFVQGGKGLIGIHAATDNFYDWPEGAAMLGGLFDGHPWGSGGTWAVKIDEPDHPLNRSFEEKGFLLSDEIYQIMGPYARDTHRVLLSLDMTNNRNRHVEGMKRDDGDFAISWIRRHGEGRVFYCSLGHNHAVLANAAVLGHYLDGIQYALGDLPVDDAPSASLDPVPVAARTTDPGAVEDPFTVLRNYDYGQSRMALSNLEDWIRDASKERKARIETDLVAVLESEETSFAGKQFACRLLRTMGTVKSIPVLKILLFDEALTDAARCALEGIPSPEVDLVFRESLDELKGDPRIGVVDSIGRRRDRVAVPHLAKCVNPREPELSLAAINALGRIGSKEASKTLMSFMLVKDLRVARDNAYLMCADRALEKGLLSTASRMYREMTGKKQAPPVRAAAWRGVFLTLGLEAAPSVATLLKEHNQDLQRVAAGFIEELPEGSDLSPLTGQLASFPPEAQCMAVAALGARGERFAAGAVTDLTRSEFQDVRVEAIRTLGWIGDASHVELLGRAAAGEEPEAGAARESLARLDGSGVDEALMARLKAEHGAVRAAMIPCMVQRRSPGAYDALLVYAADPDEDVRLEALKGLERLASREHLPALFELLDTVETEEDRLAAKRAIEAACSTCEDPEKAAALVIEALPQREDAGRATLLAVLGNLPCEASLETLTGMLDDPDPEMKNAALLALAQWPDASPLSSLLGLAGEIEDGETRDTMFAGCLRMLEMASERTPGETEKVYRSLVTLARTPDEKALIIEGVGQQKETWPLTFLKPYLDDPETKEAAQRAWVTVTAAQARTLPHAAMGCSVTLAHPFTERYSAGGKDALTDGKWGSESYGDGKWQGFEGVDVDAVIDLKSPVKLESIRVGFLQDINSWIFLPAEVVFFYSMDGKEFTHLATLDRPVPTEMLDISIEDFFTPANGQQARYVRMLAKSIGKCPAWHPGNGGDSWIFTDEIQINPLIPK